MVFINGKKIPEAEEWWTYARENRLFRSGLVRAVGDWSTGC